MDKNKKLIIKIYQQQKFICTANISMYLIEWLVFENRFSLVKQQSMCTMPGSDESTVNTEVVKEETDVEMRDVSDTSIDYEDNYSIVSTKTTVQSVPFLREDKIFQFEESDVEATSLASDNDNPDSSDESEDESEVEVAGVENFEDIDMSQTSQFMALFGIIFQAFYLVQAGGTAMLKFFYHLLVTFDKDTDLLLTVDALKTMTGFNFMTKSIVKYTVCNKCFAIYLPGNHQPNCTFKKYTTTSPTYCGNPLFFEPEVDHPIPLMRSRETINSTLLDIYDGAMWSEQLDKDNEPFVNHDHSLMLTLNVDWF
ncbi:hypothetical protein PHYBLDRAFT_151291 [Phycomyces blakesleeanus NRRL 1555(-)]|uniref:Uncharacterized protein n=1 Tax=Phycomyces blakesleeanus (strain ATCC 8743b / DSM 1359 / FGSC 10004 / NBRC 33097 / NRRL 1555) TaxID=763407 RepID=A0A162TDN2_PHYB8|nr:hypothetical protein PHYBLDRAFT_151291 [Phycomyces blakesleeanus NRRL 1555(-)]OAD67762.1 hypothetical protein PHYBLDRAFT_151291 [Phycomyces blakesleeanus NRRL 1555(-)]|eukprot:XP_018285802.1 hypothetical protein PHYBLDRAFT_151291 [Phycomyces blakesleeanus NRRL 1555(-)]